MKPDPGAPRDTKSHEASSSVYRVAARTRSASGKPKWQRVFELGKFTPITASDIVVGKAKIAKGCTSVVTGCAAYSSKPSEAEVEICANDDNDDDAKSDA